MDSACSCEVPTLYPFRPSTRTLRKGSVAEWPKPNLSFFHGSRIEGDAAEPGTQLLLPSLLPPRVHL